MAPTHFTRVGLKNFKGHANTQVPLSRFTLLVGANGTGKTSVLEAAELLCQMPFAESETAFLSSIDPELLLRSYPEGSMFTNDSSDLRVSLEFGGGPVSLELRLSRGAQQSATFFVGTQKQSIGVLDSVHLPESIKAAKGVGLLRLDPRTIAAPSQSSVEFPVVGSDGSGLATALKEIKANKEARFDQFRNAVRAVVPAVEDFRFARRKRTASRARSIRVEDQVIEVPESYDVIEDELLVRFTDTGFVRARAASEGTLITIALLGLLYANEQPPRLILIDDLDRGLHIEAQAQLVKALRKVLELHPETQIMATGHSPYLADHFDPSEVVVLRRAAPGAAIEATRLSEHPDKVLREFKTGEALVATGKDWFG